MVLARVRVPSSINADAIALVRVADFEFFIGSAAGASLMGSDLYNKMTKYLINHLMTVREVRSPFLHFIKRALSMAQPSRLKAAETLVDEELLQYYAKEWTRYTTGANYIHRLFAYLNRHWVKREKDEGRKGVYPVYTVRFVGLLLIVRKRR